MAWSKKDLKRVINYWIGEHLFFADGVETDTQTLYREYKKTFQSTKKLLPDFATFSRILLDDISFHQKRSNKLTIRRGDVVTNVSKNRDASVFLYGVSLKSLA